MWLNVAPRSSRLKMADFPPIHPSCLPEEVWHSMKSCERTLYFHTLESKGLQTSELFATWAQSQFSAVFRSTRWEKQLSSFPRGTVCTACQRKLCLSAVKGGLRVWTALSQQHLAAPSQLYISVLPTVRLQTSGEPAPEIQPFNHTVFANYSGRVREVKWESWGYRNYK